MENLLFLRFKDGKEQKLGLFWIWSVAYADDNVLIAHKKLKTTMKRLEIFLDGRKLNLNVENSKKVFKAVEGKAEVIKVEEFVIYNVCLEDGKR